MSNEEFAVENVDGNLEIKRGQRISIEEYRPMIYQVGDDEMYAILVPMYDDYRLDQVKVLEHAALINENGGVFNCDDNDAVAYRFRFKKVKRPIYEA